MKTVNGVYTSAKIFTDTLEDYLHDLQVVQQFANLNRDVIVDKLCKGMKWKVLEEHSIIHNYIDFRREQPILRKGAISAEVGELVVISINTRDGIILGTGLGNSEWNYSAPHGSGRIIKRHLHTVALRILNVRFSIQ